MVETLYQNTSAPVSQLVESIKQGKIALPDIQRPFVWPTAKVRDLFDSLYRGFPVGYLLLWDTGAEAGARKIGVETPQTAPSQLIVDGQQRLTSLFAVLTGATVLRDDFSETQIKIAFRPTDGTFAVADAAIERDQEFIPNIAALYGASNIISVATEYVQKLRERRPVDQAEEGRIYSAINRVVNLQYYSFTVIELSDSVDEEQVAEIFVRINSEGVSLLQADFILTLMSVFWEKGRRDLEEFCRASRTPTVAGGSPFNWYLAPQPPQLLRAVVAMGFRRAVLKHIYTLLRGKDLETGRSVPERREKQFARLAEAQEHVLDLTHWHEFLLCLERAGFRGRRMISSDNAIVFSYVFWLVGRVDYHVSIPRLREIIARWFFMAHTTGRYSGSFETQVERDLGRLADVPAGDADGFARVLDSVVDDTFTHDYWEITLPNELASSAAKSPALLAYIAALNIVDADVLLSTTKVRVRLDPAVTFKKGIERHHLFPRAYLREQGLTNTRQINQIANMALVEWSDNVAISDRAPGEYWPAQLEAKQLGGARLAEQHRWHALPDEWAELPYDEFLAQRRTLMARVVRTAFERLGDQQYAPVYPAPGPPSATTAPARTSYSVKIKDLLDAGLLEAGAVLINQSDDAEATVLPDGRLEVDGTVYDSPSAAGAAAKGAGTNGWTYWLADADGLRTLATLRTELLQQDDHP